MSDRLVLDGAKEIGYERFTMEDVIADLLFPSGKTKIVQQWKKRMPSEIVTFVSGFVHDALPKVTPADVGYVLERSSHALGTLDKAQDTEQFINEANPPWAMVYLFHACLERYTKRLPTWGEFLTFVMGEAESKWWGPVLLSAVSRGVEVEQAARAMRWRLATAWQSAIRTVHTLATLRYVYRVPVRYHLFGHVEVRVDGWYKQRAYRVVMPSRYESTKMDPRETFAGTSVEVHDLEIERQGYGRVWMASPGRIEAASAFLGSTRREVASEQRGIFS